MDRHVDLDNRFRAGLLGAVVGDALGVPVEFRSRAVLARDPVTGMRGYGTHGQPAGTWSDDTSMALCLAESIVRAGWDLDDQAARYARWAFEGAHTPYGETFDIGGTTGSALGRYRAGMPAASCGGSSERDNGNGALMRILPAALWFADAPDEMIARALSDASAVTHAHGRSRLSCAWFGLFVSELAHGTEPARAVPAATARLQALIDAGLIDEAAAAEIGSLSRLRDGSIAGAPEAAIRSGGYVIDTLEAAVWCLLRASSFEECVLAAVNLGEDTDTTGTVAGGLAGLTWGLDSIPTAWLETLAGRAEVEQLLESLFGCCVRPVPFDRAYWVLPGRLLAGAYPGARDEPAAIEKLDALLDAGVAACIDLTEAGEHGLLPYVDLLASRAERRGRPCAVYRLPVIDVTPPSMETIVRAHELIDRHLHAGETVYVHCYGGHGRTGVIIGTWLIRAGLTTPRRAVSVLRHLRRNLAHALHPSPETDDQVAVVEGWGS